MNLSLRCTYLAFTLQPALGRPAARGVSPPCEAQRAQGCQAPSFSFCAPFICVCLSSTHQHTVSLCTRSNANKLAQIKRTTWSKEGANQARQCPSLRLPHTHTDREVLNWSKLASHQTHSPLSTTQLVIPIPACAVIMASQARQ